MSTRVSTLIVLRRPLQQLDLQEMFSDSCSLHDPKGRPKYSIPTHDGRSKLGRTIENNPAFYDAIPRVVQFYFRTSSDRQFEEEVD